MKTQMLYIAARLALILLIPAALQAQMDIKQPLLRVDIPFAFVAGGVHLPAGQYRVYHPGSPYLVVVEKDDGGARAVEYVHPSAIAAAMASTKLVFNKYGDQYFLSQVWTEADAEVNQCFKSQMEKALMTRVSNPQLVVLAAKPFSSRGHGG
jgi:hypothetical protein